jgi:hypothetical protein
VSEYKRCEDHLDEFCRWCYSKVIELKKDEPEDMQFAKEILKKVLPGGLGKAISEIQMAPLCPRDILALMPEFAVRLTNLLDNLCPEHAAETLEEVMPLLSGFIEVIGSAANQVAGDIAEEKQAADKHQNRIDDPNLN